MPSLRDMMMMARLRQRGGRESLSADPIMAIRNDRMRGRVSPMSVQGGPASRATPLAPGGERKPSGTRLSGGQAAVDFGRAMTGGVGAAAVDQLSRATFDRLAGKGIYKDDLGTWQIRGLERPIDTGRMIRDAAVAAMDPSGRWGDLVAQSEAALRGTIYTPQPTVPKPIAVTVAPATKGPVQTTPGASGVPPLGQPRSVPGTARPPAPQPGLGGVPTLAPPGQSLNPQLPNPRQQTPNLGTQQPAPSLNPQLPHPGMSAGWPSKPSGASIPSGNVPAGNMTPGRPNTGYGAVPQQNPAAYGYNSTGMRQQTPNLGTQQPSPTLNPQLGPRGVPMSPRPGGFPGGFGTNGPTMIPQNQAPGIQGLGDRIRAIVTGGAEAIQRAAVANQPMTPQAPIPGGASLADQIRQTVDQRLGQNRPGPITPATPQVPTPGSTGVTPGGTSPVPQPGGGPPQPPGGTSPVPPAPAGTIGSPSGQIPMNLNVAYGRGGDWATVNQYDAAFVHYGNQYGVDPAMLKAMAVIESGGQMIPNQGGSGAYGIMQIKPDIWGAEAARLGFDLYTPEGQIGFAAAFLGGAVQGVAGSTPEERFLNAYYPTPCLDCPGEDGHTPRQYLQDMQTLIGIINGAGQMSAPPTTGQSLNPQLPVPTDGTGPIPTPQGEIIPPDGTNPRIATGLPMPQVQQIDSGSPIAAGGVSPQLVGMITPNNPNAVIYGDFKDPTDAGYYDYFEGHGGSANQHTGIDIGGKLGDPVATTVGGTVVCAGTMNGPGANGSGCAAFNDVTYGGAGRVEVMLDNGYMSILFGHMNTSAFAPGQRVNPGDIIGGMGGMNSDHVHLEARIWCSDGNYIIVDPSLMLAGHYNNFRC